MVWWQWWRQHPLYHVKMFKWESEQMGAAAPSSRTASRSLRVVRSDKREPSCSISHFVLVISSARWSCATDPRRAGRRILIKQLSARRSFDFLFQLPPARTGTGRIALLIFFSLTGECETPSQAALMTPQPCNSTLSRVLVCFSSLTCCNYVFGEKRMLNYCVKARPNKQNHCFFSCTSLVSE